MLRFPRFVFALFVGSLWCAISALAQPVSVAVGDGFGPIRDAPVVPEHWAESRGEECYARGRGRDGVIAQARICDGPRRVPISMGEVAMRASRLGLGTRPAVDRLRIGRPPEAWLSEVEGPTPADLLWPVARGLFSRGFGHVRRQAIRHRPHLGVDIVAESGAPIRSANDGLVVYADNGVRGYGNLLAIVHADGTSTFYGHCQAIYVGSGALVVRGQTVATVGATGSPVIPHLHFEWRRRGRARDPMPYFAERPRARDIRPPGGPRFAPPPVNRWP